MKSILFILSTLFLLSSFSSCQSAKEIENSSIVGTWQLQSVFNGYVNGGNFKWNDVPLEQSHLLTFTKDGQYNQKNTNSNVKECNGTYLLPATDSVEINTDCNLEILKMFVSELSINTLIIDHQGREGKIRDRYTRIK